MKIIGIQALQFKGKDGQIVAGKNLFVTDRIPADRGEGFSAEKVFLSDNRLAALGFIPKVGDYIQIFYNRYGKVETLIKSSNTEEEIPFDE